MQMHNIFLQKGSLSIRNAVADDASIVCGWWNDGRVMEHAGFPEGLKTTEEKVIRQIGRTNADGALLILMHEDLAIGEMHFSIVGNGTADVGIKVCDPRYQNKGFGSTYLSMLFHYLFGELGFKKIILGTTPENTRARHVYEKLGFELLEIKENSWKDQTGAFRASVHYELTAEAFNAKAETAGI